MQEDDNVNFLNSQHIDIHSQPNLDALPPHHQSIELHSRTIAPSPHSQIQLIRICSPNPTLSLCALLAAVILPASDEVILPSNHLRFSTRPFCAHLLPKFWPLSFFKSSVIQAPSVKHHFLLSILCSCPHRDPPLLLSIPVNLLQFPIQIPISFQPIYALLLGFWPDLSVVCLENWFPFVQDTPCHLLHHHNL